MATRKQRARRAKTFRHDYALVTYDEEGNEVEVSNSELRGKTGDEQEAPKAAGTSGARSTGRATGPQPPSWERALKRGGLTGVGLALLIVLLLHGPLVLGLVYGVLFIPLTYWMDGLSYRWYQKRQAASAAQKTGPKTKPGARKGRSQ